MNDEKIESQQRSEDLISYLRFQSGFNTPVSLCIASHCRTIRFQRTWEKNSPGYEAISYMGNAMKSLPCHYK